ncbi:unnamed protein product [Boreogadus saida]
MDLSKEPGQRCGKGDEGPSAQQATGEPVTVDWSQTWPRSPAVPDHKRVPQRPSGPHSGRGHVITAATGRYRTESADQDKPEPLCGPGAGWAGVTVPPVESPRNGVNHKTRLSHGMTQ